MVGVALLRGDDFRAPCAHDGHRVPLDGGHLGVDDAVGEREPLATLLGEVERQVAVGLARQGVETDGLRNLVDAQGARHGGCGQVVVVAGLRGDDVRLTRPHDGQRVPRDGGHGGVRRLVGHAEPLVRRGGQFNGRTAVGHCLQLREVDYLRATVHRECGRHRHALRARVAHAAGVAPGIAHLDVIDCVSVLRGAVNLCPVFEPLVGVSMVGHVEREGHRLVHGLHVVVHARLDLFGYGVDVRHGDDVRIRARRVDVAVEHRALRCLADRIDRGCFFNSVPTDASVAANLPIDHVGVKRIGQHEDKVLVGQEGFCASGRIVASGRE